MSDGVVSVHCAVCHKRFKRLSAHIAQTNCEYFYLLICQDAILADDGNVATVSSTTRRKIAFGSNDLPSTIYPLVGHSSSTMKISSYSSATPRRSAQPSRGDESLCTSTSQEPVRFDHDAEQHYDKKRLASVARYVMNPSPKLGNDENGDN